MSFSHPTPALNTMSSTWRSALAHGTTLTQNHNHLPHTTHQYSHPPTNHPPLPTTTCPPPTTRQPTTRPPAHIPTTHYPKSTTTCHLSQTLTTHHQPTRNRMLADHRTLNTTRHCSELYRAVAAPRCGTAFATFGWLSIAYRLGCSARRAACT
jgi:hypothetical protein